MIQKAEDAACMCSAILEVKDLSSNEKIELHGFKSELCKISDTAEFTEFDLLEARSFRFLTIQST